MGKSNARQFADYTNISHLLNKPGRETLQEWLMTFTPDKFEVIKKTSKHMLINLISSLYKE